MLDMTLATAKNIAIIVVIALAAIALITAKLMAGLTKKLVALLIFSAIALGVWTQRVSLQSCADDVRAAGGKTETTCHFLSYKIRVAEPLGTVPPVTAPPGG